MLRVLRGRARWPAVVRTTTTTTTRRLLTTKTQASTSAVTEYNLTSPFSPVTPHADHIFAQVVKSCSKWQDRVAVECGVTGRYLTFAGLLDTLLRCGGVLQRTAGGVGIGDVVAILMVNSPEYAVVHNGVLAVGATLSTINPTLTPGEVARQVKDSGAKVLIVDSILEEVASAALTLLPPSPLPHLLVMGPSSTNKPNLLAMAMDKNTPFTDPVQLSDDDNNLLMYTSGTTGTPKGAPITVGSVKSNLPAIFHPDFFLMPPTTGEYQPNLLGLVPFFHAYGMYMVFAAGLLSGAKIVTMPRFDPESFIKVIKTNRFEVLHLVPLLASFLNTPFVSAADLEALQVVMCAASPCPTSVVHALKEKAPNPIFFQELYGMTETMPVMGTPKDQECVGSAGKLLAGVTARVVDLDTQQPLPPGQRGEFWVKTPGMMKGYHNRPEETRKIFSEDGWLMTGDVVTYNEDGSFFIVDRIKELIKVKGIQVSPSELEDELLKHQGVTEACVVPVPDERAGEVPRAYVIKEGDVTEKDLTDFLSTRVAQHKQLAGGVVFVDDLPKNATGKILRRVLKERAAEECL